MGTDTLDIATLKAMLTWIDDGRMCNDLNDDATKRDKRSRACIEMVTIGTVAIGERWTLR